jgi:hypothetical protein
LKTFLTQFGSTLPLTPDPSVRLHDDQKGGTTIKRSQFGERFCKKRLIFLTHPVPTRPAYPPWAHVHAPERLQDGFFEKKNPTQ